MDKKIVRVILEINDEGVLPLLDTVAVGELEGRTLEVPLGLSPAPATETETDLLQSLIAGWAHVGEATLAFGKPEADAMGGG